MNIWVSGSIAKDVIMVFPGKFKDYIDPLKIHVLSLSFAVENLKESFGGTAANICYNLSLLGIKPKILGNLGFDYMQIQKNFKNWNINYSNVHKSVSKKTASAYIITDQADNQITGFYEGAMSEVRRLPKVRINDWAIIAAENTKNMARLAKHYKKCGVNYFFDPGQQITAFSKKALHACLTGARVLIGNDYEIGFLNKKVQYNKYKKLIIVKTLGSNGSEVLENSKKYKIRSAKASKVVDPTGAGDAYRAGFLKGMILGYNLKMCGQLGSVLSSFAVEQNGTQNHKITKKQFSFRYKSNFSDKINEI